MELPRLHSPIVLVHGLLGFARIDFGGRAVAEYFPGVREYLSSAGNRVFYTRVSPTGSVRRRAAELRDCIRRECGREKVHVVGHSMGGLDARYMISRLGMDEQVRSLTTVATPHRGSSFADWGLRRFERLLRPLCELFGVPVDAFYDLTRTASRQFNKDVPDAPGVRYFSVAGQCDGKLLGPEWQLPYHVVKHAEGPNDGVVSVESARWGERFEVWSGNHMEVVNWPNPVARLRGRWRDRAPEYAGLVRQMAAVEGG